MSRKIWMFPRNIRRLEPWKISEILTQLSIAVIGRSWSGEQELQDEFTDLLEESGIKRPGEQWDPNSGGARTYLAQLRCLGLVFKHPDYGIQLTLAGEAFIDGKPPLEILQHQLSKLQYPSPYSKSRNVWIDKSLEIRPFLFLLRLLRDQDLNGLTKDEIAFFVIVYGHKNSDFVLVKKKIQNYREINQDPFNKKYMKLSETTKTSNHSITDRKTYLRDIANTAVNYLLGAQLVFREENRVKINLTFESKIDNWIQNEPDLLTAKVPDHVFQRRFGAYGKQKDTRKFDPNRSANVKQLTKEKIINNEFLKIASQQPLCYDDLSLVVEKISNKTGIQNNEIRNQIKEKIVHGISYFERQFLNYSVGGRDTALDFEKSACEILDEIDGIRAFHTGQLTREGIGGYADVFVYFEKSNDCGIIDLKASGAYSISSDHHYRMVKNYVPNYHELSNKLIGDKSPDLSFFAYVAGGLSHSVEEDVQKICNKTGVNGVALDAHDFLVVVREVIEDKMTIKKLKSVFEGKYQVN